MPRRKEIYLGNPLTPADCETCKKDIEALKAMDEMFEQMECAGVDCKLLRKKRDELLEGFRKILETFFPDEAKEV
jgi:hypothetical protein